jgi:pimeloyl-ACP methyl ester carboxylesterase
LSKRGVIVFSHANGFPAGTYRVLFETWRRAGYAVRALEKFGHDPRYPVSSNWPHLRDQLIHFIEQETKEPAYLVGHSLGGLLSLLAACKRPDLVRGLVMLDSPIFTGWRAHSVQMLKASGLMQRIGPGRISMTRRQHWPSRKHAHEHYAVKHIFARWDPRVLRDYIDAGVEPDGEGQARLAFDRAVETRIYNTLPHNIGMVLLRHPPRCPVAFVAGTQSLEMRQAGGAAASRALARGGFVWMEGTHLFPMERPEETATQVLQLISSFSTGAATRNATTRPV